MVMRAPRPVWTVDPDDPRAPPLDVWEAMTPAQRKRVVAALPSEFPVSQANPPEGDAHFNAKVGARDALGQFFRRKGKRVYLACELPVYYPGERFFAPDVMAVLDVDTHQRERWTVAEEGKGLDFALEVIVSGKRRKDLETNVERYARLGIAEYFIFDRGRLSLSAYRLPSPSSSAYQPVLGQLGRYTSQVLGLDVRIEGTRLRFFDGSASLPEADELIANLERMMYEVEQRVRAAEEREAEERARRKKEARARKEEARARKEEARARKEEARAREEAERRVAELTAKVERLEAELAKR